MIDNLDSTILHTLHESPMSFDNPLLRVLERMGCGAIFVDGTGHVLSFNEVAAQVISDVTGTEISTNGDLRDKFKTLISRSANRFTIESESWVSLSRDSKKDVVIYSIPMGEGIDSYGISLIIILNLEIKSGPSHDVLRKIFRLSPSESTTALQILDGKTISEIAEERRISAWTVRTQLSAVFDKTNTRRQSDLVSLLIKLSILP